MQVSHNIIQKMQSATHFAKEVPMNMTQLAEILETFSDSIFSVSFHKQPTIDNVKELLEGSNFADLKDK